ncbi:MAG: sulfite exporter TauE/SafE family protein [Blastocatellia bacterium]
MTKNKAGLVRRGLPGLGATAFLFAVIVSFAGPIAAHPLGNFTINHYARIEIRPGRLNVRCVIDMAEIPAFQELQRMGDGSPSDAQLKSYAEQEAHRYAAGIELILDGAAFPLEVVSAEAGTRPGAGGLPTLRIECDLTAAHGLDTADPHRMRFENTNYRDRLGWREVAVVPALGFEVFNSSAFANNVTDELNAYPEDSLSAPLDERVIESSFVKGRIPAGARVLMTREGRPAERSRDRLADLISVPEITPIIALLGLLISAGLGALHALSPGHGKTVVGAYLVGSRGTARHAVFLGLTVTVTHTFGVIALGVVTLFASQYIAPDKLFPVLSLISGAIVLLIGVTLFTRRLRAAILLSKRGKALRLEPHGDADEVHRHDGLHTHDDSDNQHNHDLSGSSMVHSHGGRPHSHLPPGGDGSRVTWRSLLALGISGGLLPCPSALVVMLSAISLHRVTYGLVLVVAFSVGLAVTLTAIGLAFVYAGRLIKRPIRAGRFVSILPVISAFVIACAGASICFEALPGAETLVALGSRLARAMSGPNGRSLSTMSMLSIGLVFGLKHAIEADHLAAVSAIVSERKSLLSSTLVGGLWGIGHTIALLIAGVVVLLMRVEIGEGTARALEFCVALMLIALGVNALRKIAHGGKFHFHAHKHGCRAHMHPHIHENGVEPDAGAHHGLNLNFRPLFVGMVHGLAGSAALMLLVLSTVPSRLLGVAYILIFGVGSIGGMMLMSALVSLPIHVTATRYQRTNRVVRVLAAIFSLGLGLFMAYEIGFSSGRI